jgi:hypothetical protein
MKKLSLLGEVWALIRARKRWMLLPLLLLVAVFAVLLVVAQASPLAPFIYTIF